MTGLATIRKIFRNSARLSMDTDRNGRYIARTGTQGAGLTNNQQGAMTMSNHTAEEISNAVSCCRQLIQQEELQTWCTEHAGESMADIVSECPPCEDWYPEVDIDGDLTGEIVHAQDEDYQMFRNDDRTQCVVCR